MLHGPKSSTPTMIIPQLIYMKLFNHSASSIPIAHTFVDYKELNLVGRRTLIRKLRRIISAAVSSTREFWCSPLESVVIWILWSYPRSSVQPRGIQWYYPQTSKRLTPKRLSPKGLLCYIQHWGTIEPLEDTDSTTSTLFDIRHAVDNLRHVPYNM